MALEKFWWSNFGNLMKIEPTVNILKIHPGVLCLGYEAVHKYEAHCEHLHIFKKKHNSAIKNVSTMG